MDSEIDRAIPFRVQPSQLLALSTLTSFMSLH